MVRAKTVSELIVKSYNASMYKKEVKMKTIFSYLICFASLAMMFAISYMLMQSM
jgi:hypothetical protein